MMRVTLSKDSLHPLLEAPPDLCISLFLPTDRTGVERPQDYLRLRRLLREAKNLLRCTTPLRSTQVEDLLEPLRAILDNEEFWQHASDGLAIFRSWKVFRALRLPARFQERVVVSTHFYLKPLLPLLSYDGHFYVLALSHNAVRLLACTPKEARELPLPEQVPPSLAAFLKGEERTNDLQAYSSASFGTIGKGGRHPAIFHGQGAGTDEAKEDLLRSFQQIDRGLHGLLRDERMPLVLAGVAYLFPLYQQANTYPHLLEQGIAGNPEQLKAEELRRKAWDLVEPVVLQAQQEAAAAYRAFAGTERTSNQTSQIVSAAFYGRVASLFVDRDQEQWGIFDPATDTLEIHTQVQPRDEDVLDLAAIQTLLHGGAVYALSTARCQMRLHLPPCFVICPSNLSAIGECVTKHYGPFYVKKMSYNGIAFHGRVKMRTLQWQIPT